MSRIEQALRRAAEDRGEERPDLAQSENSSHVAEKSVIEQYPMERGGVSRRIEPVAPLHDADRSRVILAPILPQERQRIDSGAGGKLVASSSAPQLLIEQYRRLAAVLLEAQAERQLKTLAITSARPREGKTLTTANLALTLSESYGRRVLLIDADLRRPGVHDALGISNGTGLSDVLRSPRRELPLIAVTPCLSVLTAGRTDQNPLEALSSDRMRELLDDCAARFDWVLLDTPPVGLLTDAQIVARLSGAVLFVIGVGSTPHAAVERSIAELGRECIIGTVLNRVGDGAIPETSYYGDYSRRDDENSGSSPSRR
jgi:protein-tyrosine kinase